MEELQGEAVTVTITKYSCLFLQLGSSSVGKATGFAGSGMALGTDGISRSQVLTAGDGFFSQLSMTSGQASGTLASSGTPSFTRVDTQAGSGR